MTILERTNLEKGNSEQEIRKITTMKRKNLKTANYGKEMSEKKQL